MAQDFPDIPASTDLSDSRTLILQRDDTLKSNFSGTAFPASSIVLGQMSYRTDQGKLYLLTNTSPTTWTEVTLAGSTAFLPSSGGTLTGNTTLESGAVNQIILQVSDGSVEITRDTGGAFIDFKNARAENYDVRLVESSGGLNLLTTASGVLAVNGNTVWHSANDGAASGLDSDLLDGQHGTYYTDIVARLGYTPANKAGDTITGNLVMNGGAIKEDRANNVASGATVNLSTLAGNLCHITGTTTITAITLDDGQRVTVVFDDVLTLTHAAALVLPGGANITTAAGDVAVFVGDTTVASGVRCVSYIRASGINLPNMTTARLVGRTTAGTGQPEEISVGSGLTLSAGVLAASSTGGPTTIASGSFSGTTVAITSIPATYAYLVLEVVGASFTGTGNHPVVQVDTDNGASYDTTVGNYVGWIISATPSLFGEATLVPGPADGGASTTHDFTLIIKNYHAGPTKMLAEANYQGSPGITWWSKGSSAMNALRIIGDGGGTFDAGTYALYGVS